MLKPSKFVHPVASVHTSHYEELAHLSSARRLPQSNTSHYGHLPVGINCYDTFRSLIHFQGNPGRESSHKLHKADLHEPHRNSPPTAAISYPASTDLLIPLSLNRSRDPFDVRNDSTTRVGAPQSSAYPQTATAAKKEQGSRGLATAHPLYMPPMSKNPSPQLQQSRTLMPSDNELPPTAPINASTQSHLPIDQAQVHGMFESIARGPSSNVAPSKPVPLQYSSSIPLTSSDNSHSALLSNHAFERNERTPPDTIPEARLRHQVRSSHADLLSLGGQQTAPGPWYERG